MQPGSRRFLGPVSIFVFVVLLGILLWFTRSTILGPFVRTFLPAPSPNSAPFLDPTKDTSYALPLEEVGLGLVQLNGKIKGVEFDRLVVVAGGREYEVSDTFEGYVECRDPLVFVDTGETVPAQTVFYDLSRYIENIENNASEYLEDGLIFRYTQVVDKIEDDVNVLAVARETDKEDYSLFLLIVYGCN